MISDPPDRAPRAAAGAPVVEPLAGEASERGSSRLEAVLARCRAGLEDYAARRERWWRERLASANAAARQARSLAFGRKGTGQR